MKELLSKADRTKQFIIKTTAGIFNTKGFAGTSMSDITDATGLTKGSIYGNFENKEAVAVAAFDFNYVQLAKITSQKIAGVKTFYDKLMVYAQAPYNLNNNMFPEGGCPILNTAIEADDTNKRLKARAAKALLKWQKNIIELVQGGIAAGEFKQVEDPEQLAMSIIALVEGSIMIAKVTDNPVNLDKVMKTTELIISQLRK